MDAFKVCIVILSIFWNSQHAATGVKIESNGDQKVISQCFATKGNPFVTLYCGQRGSVKVNKAFHGRHITNDTDCEILEDDCTEDYTLTLYDWQECMGRQHCVVSVKQSWMPTCGNYSQYLQVHYSCVPNDEIINICNTGSYEGITEAYIQSPNYPEGYTSGLDCECDIHADGAKYLSLSFLDLTLEMEDKTACADWLLIQSVISQKYKQLDLNCGAIVQGSKNMTIRGQSATTHFHTDENDNKAQTFMFNTSKKLKGFWLYFTSEPKQNNMTVNCHPARPKVLEKLKPDPTKPSSVLFKDGSYQSSKSDDLRRISKLLLVLILIMKMLLLI